jgi:hypothetical protein
MCDVLYFKLNGIYACGQQNHQSYNYLEKGHHLPEFAIKNSSKVCCSSASEINYILEIKAASFKTNTHH